MRLAVDWASDHRQPILDKLKNTQAGFVLLDDRASRGIGIR
jgi:hypothetical protein